MLESRGAHGRITDRSSIKRQQPVLPDFVIVERGNLHKEIMWMLAIIDRLAKRGFALLKEFRIEPLRHGCRIKAHHGAQGDLAASYLPLRHGHEPTGGEELVVPSRTGLLLIVQKDGAMEHQ